MSILNIGIRELSSNTSRVGSSYSFCLLPHRQKSHIFEGVIAYIDGETSVPYTTLRQMMCDHGGRFEPVSFGVKLTHFVAENVSFAKYKDL